MASKVCIEGFGMGAVTLTDFDTGEAIPYDRIGIFVNPSDDVLAVEIDKDGVRQTRHAALVTIVKETKFEAEPSPSKTSKKKEKPEGAA